MYVKYVNKLYINEIFWTAQNKTIKKLDGTLWKNTYARMLIYKISYINKFAVYIGI